MRDLWQILKEDARPIMLYGMGDGALKIMRELKNIGREVQEIFASDEFVRGHSFEDKRVRKFSEIVSEYDDFIILVAFGVHDAPTMQRLYDMSARYTLFAPDVPVAGEGLFDLAYVKENEVRLRRIYNLLADDASKNVFECTVMFKLTGKIEYLKRMESDAREMYDLLALGDAENYIDLGAYDGDTVREFLHFTGGKYESITALEPDARNFKKLVRNHPEICAINAGAWDEDCVMEFATRGGRNSRVGKGREINMRAVDSVARGASLIKLDVEGAEMRALCGAEKTISRFKPKLVCAVYHRNEDIFALPEKILELNPDYKLYMRHFPYIPAWEINVIAI